MQIHCENCDHDNSGAKWRGCERCENFSRFTPKGHKEGQPYHVRVSELRYGEVTVWAASEEEAKDAVVDAEINFFDSEIMDMTVETTGLGECPLGGDIENDCVDCAYSGDFYFKNGECVSRREDKENGQI